MLKVVKFSASWCSPCHLLKPIVEKIRILYSDNVARDEVMFEDYDVDIHSDKAQQYKVSSIPTLVFERNGQEVSRLVGLVNEARITSVIDEFI